MKSSLKVKNSGIHGKGLFASKKIEKGTLLGSCKTKKTREEGLYTLTLDEQTQVDVTCKFKYINHSKLPNVAYYEDLSVVALQNISAGDELTHDYGDEWE